MIKSKELRFQAGRMEVIDGKVKPNPAKGEIRIYLNLDNLLCFNWVETQHASSFTFEPLVIFPDEWTWERLNTRKGRAYMLRNKAFEEDRFFFWLQSADTSKDQEMEALIQGILKSGELGDRPQEAQPRSLQSHEQNQKMLDDISKVLHGNRSVFPRLGNVLSSATVRKYLQGEEFIQKALSMLPEGQQSKEHYLDNVTSPQFRQALESLTEALNSENFFSVIQSFGLDSKIAQGSLDGVEAFIKCIIQKYKEGKEDK